MTSKPAESSQDFRQRAEELFRVSEAIIPESIIISSGYGGADVGSRIGIEDVAGFVSKPYGPDNLQEVLKAVVRGE